MPERRIVTQAKGSRRLFVVKQAMSFALRLVAVLLALAPHTVWAHSDHDHEARTNGIAKPYQVPNASPAPCPGGAAQECGCRSAAAGQEPPCIFPSPSWILVRASAAIAPACDTPCVRAFSSFAYPTRAPPPFS